MKMVVRFTFSTFLPFGYHISTHRTFVQAIHTATNTGDKKQAIYKLFAAYIHTIPLEELIESVERAEKSLRRTIKRTQNRYSLRPTLWSVSIA
jgi:hypothetical protein